MEDNRLETRFLAEKIKQMRLFGSRVHLCAQALDFALEHILVVTLCGTQIWLTPQKVS
jgi:hypothetical protein